MFFLVVAGCVGVAVIGLVSDRSAASEMHVTVTGCKFSGGDVLPAATVEYTVTNNGDSARGVTVRFEYRDSAGNRIDTDTAHVKSIAPGDTVRAEETTLLDATVSSGICAITGVS
ncbi:FxLYD domain-containing protein [Paractinoplanes durhamensis]|uniref:FxLYD domain-containing protein n=1 Tax=Paractinoplanes durhamensis TaxID=113563 RepID=UPI001945220E|nr:FxLYD domain-containing protein [Actinoplanes durhamensis]